MSKMPKLDIEDLPIDTRTNYPPPFDRVVHGRERRRLGNAAGLDQFGVNLTTLRPGAASALRHWHQTEDELVYVLEGEVVLIEDGGETLLRDGDGIAVVTWDEPGRSMNVIDGAVMDELSTIVEQTTADAAVKGVVITSAKDAFCAGADLTMLEGLSRTFAELIAAQGEEAATL